MKGAPDMRYFRSAENLTICDACGKVMLFNSCSHSHATAECAGTIVLLIDESGEMATPIAGGTKSKAESVATAVNSLLNQLAAGPNVRLVIVGYGDEAGGDQGAQIRWIGPLAGRSTVNSSELAAAPALVEDRIRRIPSSAGVGVAREEAVRFPVWYVPQQSAGKGIEEAASFVARTLAEAGDDSSRKRPLVIHICGKLPDRARLRAQSVKGLLETSLWQHLHLGTNNRIPAIMYPSSSRHLANADVAALFEVSCVLGEPLAAALRTANVAVTPGARGMVHQASMGDLIRFLALGKAYAAATAEALAPEEAAESTVSCAGHETTVDVAAATALVEPPPSLRIYERVALILVADRSETDPASGVWLHRQEQLNEIIARFARRAGNDVEVGLIVYGRETVETGFHGPLEGRTMVADIELADGALRMEQITEKVSNGIGGLVSVKRSRPIFVDQEADQPAHDLESVVAALAELIGQIRRAHEGEAIMPLVLHVTGGGFSAEAVAGAAAQLAGLGEVLVYNVIVPESPLPTVAYPSNADLVTDPRLAALWRMASPLAGAHRIATKRRHVTQASRGFVVGARFDLLLESIQALLGKEH